MGGADGGLVAEIEIRPSPVPHSRLRKEHFTTVLRIKCLFSIHRTSDGGTVFSNVMGRQVKGISSCIPLVWNWLGSGLTRGASWQPSRRLMGLCIKAAGWWLVIGVARLPTYEYDW